MFVQVREAEAERKRKAEREKSFQPPPTKTDSKVDASKGAVGYIRRINTLVWLGVWLSADDLVDVTELKKKVSQAMKVCNKAHRSSVSLCVSDMPSLSVAEEEEEVNIWLPWFTIVRTTVSFSSYSFSHKCPIYHECFWFHASLLTLHTSVWVRKYMADRFSCCLRKNVASFPGRSHLQFLIRFLHPVYAIRNWRRKRPGNEARKNEWRMFLKLIPDPVWVSADRQ